MNRMMRVRGVVGALLLIATPAASAPLSAPEDIVRLKTVGSPRISPDGTRIVYTVRETDFENNRFLTSLWMVGWDGSKPTRLIEKGSLSSPRWAPDGKRLAFYMSKDRDTQIYVMTVDEGKMAPLATTGKHGPISSHTFYSGLEWSPDGRTLVFAAQDVNDPDDPFLWKDWYRSEGFGN